MADEFPTPKPTTDDIETHGVSGKKIPPAADPQAQGGHWPSPADDRQADLKHPAPEAGLRHPAPEAGLRHPAPEAGFRHPSPKARYKHSAPEAADKGDA